MVGLLAARGQHVQKAAASQAAPRGTIFPHEVASYQVRPVWALLPEPHAHVAALVVADAPEEDEELPEWVPASWRSPVLADSNTQDVYGAIGVWPAAFAVVERLRVDGQLQSRAARHCKERGSAALCCVEMGCGAGLPSLAAAALLPAVGCRVGDDSAVVDFPLLLELVAVDSEALPLAFIKAAFEAQQHVAGGPFPEGVSLRCLQADLIEVATSGSESREGGAETEVLKVLEQADLILVSDVLYTPELGRALGVLLGRAVRPEEKENAAVAPPAILLACGGRRGRNSFLEAFQAELGPEGAAWFEELPVPTWAAGPKGEDPPRDLFDGEPCKAVECLCFRLSTH